ncbi:hypothetical protein ACFWA4_05900 [Streptomyces sp. NPDC060011]|uniref:hypothetical protein n=1 Tax=Streptomyces sp. NPDC060011 TaxID=3347037 RepID=UPI00369A03D1
MTLDVSGIYAQTLSHAKRLGLFQRVLSHEPRSAPGSGLTCCIWAASYSPVDRLSGLDTTSMRLELGARIYINFKAQPEDDIDKKILDATSKFIDSFTGDIQLGGHVMEVDLLGAYGNALGARWGYLEIDKTLYRVADLVVPLIISDIYTQDD